MLKSSIVVAICTTSAISSSINPVVAQNTNNLFIADATASSKNTKGMATNVLDNNDNTWWNADGKGQYLELNTGGLATVNAVKIKFYEGDKRTSTFDVDVSTDGISWKRVLADQNSQRTADLERYGFNNQRSRYIRLVNRGNAIAIRQVVVEGVPQGKTYYVDCTNGSDNNNGTTPSSAWKTLNPVNRWSNPLKLNPGDSLLLKRGCSFKGPLNARWTGSSNAPIAFGAYGSSALPLPAIDKGAESNEVVKITGQHQIFEYIKVRATKPGGSANAQKCKSQPVGWLIGFDTRSGSSHNIVRYSEASGFTAGVRFGEGSRTNKALFNRLTFNNVMDRLTPRSQNGNDDAGAWGILLNGDYNEVAYNYFEGNVGCSEDYDVDGASVEVYKGSNNYIHHNTSWRESTFTELGGTSDERAENNKYAYNTYSAFGFESPYISPSTLDQLQKRGGEFLLVRGYKSGWGANLGTEFYHNTGYWLNGGILCIEGCSADILQARNNIMVASQNPHRYLVESDAKFGESNNIYWQADSYSGPQLLFIAGSNSPNPASKKVDPLFVDPASANFRLRSGSSAINAATNVELSWANSSQDIYGNSASRGSARDIGAAEY
ncbi:discoidin domain-containing protein [Aliterella atlantica]|uniref:F5/8 type C domain-containing protein n=1 Tax=Aliterella atlantica CENA595 TaxID=1618023 RepID=A0A0D8ZSG1_9CYAN|nr:discoidin domain-containing protein [Aliterella atlantica]KJH71449.1 hypothetical protein UH38_12955 [Aliterella atlantica CENA595]